MRLEVGRILRAHGVRGEVVVRYVSDRDERRQPGAVLDTPAGPLTVERARRLPAGDWVVKFAEVEDRDGAEGLRGRVLSAEPIEDPDELWVHELIGASVVDEGGADRGRIAEVHEGPVSDLLVLEDGRVVPVTFVVAHEPGIVRVEVPEGLFDL